MTISVLKLLYAVGAFPVAQIIKNLPAMQETRLQPPGQEDPLEKEMATPSSTAAWRIPCREEAGRLQSVGSQRVGHDRVTFTATTAAYICTLII